MANPPFCLTKEIEMVTTITTKKRYGQDQRCKKEISTCHETDTKNWWSESQEKPQQGCVYHFQKKYRLVCCLLFTAFLLCKLSPTDDIPTL